ncbi:MAG: hypothetical protein K1W38_05560 [Lachnospiraceae bacterium]
MTLLDKEQKINQINEKLSVMGSRELLIVHTTIMTLYLRQQCDQLLPEWGMKSELVQRFLNPHILRNCSEITHDNYLSKCPSASSENLDIARYACDFLLGS